MSDIATNTSAPINVDTIAAFDRREAAAIAAHENVRILDLLATLPERAWSEPTDCTAWNVRDMAGHVLGAAEGFSSFRKLVELLWATKQHQGATSMVDAMTSVQVQRRADLSIGQLLDRLAQAGGPSARFRSRVPALLRSARLKQELLSGATESWSLGYLLDVILTRDTWMHRIDICRATGREPLLTAAHDGRIVADAVADWARRHAQPFTLRLSGPAGGIYTHPGDGEEFTLDAVEFCRILSGRATGTGLLAQEVPF